MSTLPVDVRIAPFVPVPGAPVLPSMLIVFGMPAMILILGAPVMPTRTPVPLMQVIVTMAVMTAVPVPGALHGPDGPDH